MKKKVLAVLTAVSVIVAFSVPSFADNSSNEDLISVDKEVIFDNGNTTDEIAQNDQLSGAFSNNG